MEKIISIKNLHNFAYCNHGICKKPVRGIVISFMGLGNMSMFKEDPEEGKLFADLGILYLVPYQNPWGWMNDRTVALSDELVDVLCKEYGEVPVVSTGRSMGGLSALVYTCYARRTPVASVANCPVCDLPFHFTERPDLPRTLYSAFGAYEGTMESAMRTASPLHLAERMPSQTEYFVFHCCEDRAVNKQKHSDRFVQEMRKHHRITYFEVPERGHCDLTDEMYNLYNACIIAAVCGKQRSDIHLHSRNSHDSEELLSNCAAAARQKNIDVIALTDHCDIQYFLERDNRRTVAASLEEARQTDAAFDGKPKVLRGIEIGDSLWNKDFTEEILNAHKYDLVIGSVHAVQSERDGEPYSVIDFSKLTETEIDRYMVQYFKDVQKTLESLPCDVMAHLTCPLRYINGKYSRNIDSRRYEEYIRPILSYIIENKIAMELNTSGADLMPDEWIIALYRKMGGYLVTLGSDAHVAQNVGKDMDNAVSMLKKYGFRFCCYYLNRRAVPCLI